LIEVRHVARVQLPEDENVKALILNLFAYTSRNGESFHNYSYKDGVAYFPPCLPKLEVVASLLNETVVDNRSHGQTISSPFILNPEFTLRDYQVEPARQLFDDTRDNKSATLSAGCGTGKTIVVSHAAGRLNKKILGILDQSNLFQNWAIAFDLIYGKKIQQLKSTDIVFSDVCITTFQMLHRNPELLSRIRKEFGCLILDECHVVKATTFKQVLSRLDTQYRVACTATFFNKNLPLGILEDWLAPVSVKMVDQYALTPEIRWIDTGVIWSSEEPMDYASYVLPALAADAKRNAVIFSILKQCLEEKRRTIVCCITVKQANFLHEIMVKSGARSTVYTGSTTAKRDLEVKTKMNSGELDFIFASMKFNKGTDIDTADCMVLVRPNNNLKDTQQLTGRVVRKVEGKPKPIVYDFADVGYLAEIFVRNRKKFYRSLNYEEG